MLKHCIITYIDPCDAEETRERGGCEFNFYTEEELNERLKEDEKYLKSLSPRFQRKIQIITKEEYAKKLSNSIFLKLNLLFYNRKLASPDYKKDGLTELMYLEEILLLALNMPFYYDLNKLTANDYIEMLINIASKSVYKIAEDNNKKFDYALKIKEPRRKKEKTA